MNLFLQRYGALVTGVLNGFDRLVFRGTLRSVVHGPRMMAYLSRVGVLIKDFAAWVKDRGDRIKEAADQAAETAGRPQHYLDSGATSKEDLAREVAQSDRVREGLITVLSCVEPCTAFEVYRNPATRWIELRSRPRRCLHLYYYLMHEQFGFMHVRLQTWAPYAIRVCINGREWLARQMSAAGMRYERHDNCFTWIEDVAAAQTLMDKQLRLSWRALLQDLAVQVNPIYEQDFRSFDLDYYWSVYQSEWASDVMFRDTADLERLYPRLIRQGITTFASGDVMRFLGRKTCADGRVNPRFHGEVMSDVKDRPEGVRIKHRVDANSIKLYDKFGSVLRVETTINNPKDFKVYRQKHGDADGPADWYPLRKNVADLPRRAEVSQKSNERYLDALATVEDTTPLRELSDALCRPTRWKGQRVRALNPLSPDDAALLAAVVRGEFLANGLRNRDLRQLLYDQPASPEQQRRRSGVITRKLRLLRAHGLIRKIPKSQRYVVSPKGQQTITALLAARNANTKELTKVAA